MNHSVSVALNGGFVRVYAPIAVLQTQESVLNRFLGKKKKPNKRVWCGETSANLTDISQVNRIPFSEKDKRKEARGWKRPGRGFSQIVWMDWVVRELGKASSG